VGGAHDDVGPADEAVGVGGVVMNKSAPGRLHAAAKARLSRQIGIPLTRSGRQRKLGAMMGCAVPVAVMVICVLAALTFAWEKF
jgi:hypothetical protein